MKDRAPAGLTDKEKDIWYRAFQSGYHMGRTDMLHTFQEWLKHEETFKGGR